MRFRNLRCQSIVLALIIVAAATQADVPQRINYQGILLDSNGDPVTTTVDVIFEIYDAPAVGNQEWIETRSVTPDAEGRFNIILGEISDITEAAFEGPSRWLQVQVVGDPAMIPRVQIVTVAYAHRPGTVDGATAGTIQGILTIEPLADPATDAGLLITGSVVDSVQSAPDDGVILRAVSNSGREVVSIDTDGPDEPVKIVIRGPGGDEEAIYDANGVAIYTDEGTAGEAARDAQVMRKRVELKAQALYFYDAFGTATLQISNGDGIPSIVVGNPEDAYTLPTGDGSGGQVLTTDGSGTVSWADPAGGGWSDGGSRVYLTTANDSVGIGTSAPTEKLDVSGNIHASGTITSGSSITIDGTTDQITATSGTISFDNENLVTTGKASFGWSNNYSGSGVFVAGGANSATGDSSVIAGGNGNYAGYLYATVGGGTGNLAGASYTTIGGGYRDTAYASYATIGGGWGNNAAGVSSTISGGKQNYATTDYSSVGGGHLNNASGIYSSVGGGSTNSATNEFTTVSGGYLNEAAGARGTVGGGSGNYAGGNYSTIAGGRLGFISHSYGAIGGGYHNRVRGAYSCVPGGQKDTVTGDYSLAYGYGVYVSTDRRVVFFDGDSSGGLWINRDDRAGEHSGQPVLVGTDGTNGNGAYLTPGGTWTSTSSRTCKKNFQPLDGQELLAAISRMPIESWEYKGGYERHIGPVAEDFVAAFDVGIIGEDGIRENKHLSHGDVAGVTLIAIQELNRKNERLEAQVAELQALVEELLAEQR